MMMIRIKPGLGIWVVVVVGLLSFAISADVVMDEPVWPVLKPEYLDRELRP